MGNSPPRMAFCDQCGQPLEGPFCSACGARAPELVEAGWSGAGSEAEAADLFQTVASGQEAGVELPVLAPSSAGFTCPICGARGLDDEFCGNCGARLGARGSAQSESDTAIAGPDSSPASAFASRGSTPAEPGRPTDAGSARDLGQLWGNADKKVIQEAALRTAGAWAAVWLLLVIAVSLVPGSWIEQLDDSSQNPGSASRLWNRLGAPAIGSALQLTGLGSKATGAFTALGVDVGQATAKLTLVSATLVLFMALRLAQVRRRAAQADRTYLVTSALVSAAGVLILTRLASSSYEDYQGAGVVGSSLTWSWLVPTLVAVALTALAAYGPPAPARFPDLRVTLATLGRLCVVMLWIALAGGMLAALTLGLGTGTGEQAGGIGALLGNCAVLVVALPNIAITLLAWVLRVGGSPANTDEFTKVYPPPSAGGPGLTLWIAIAVGIGLLVLAAYWLTSPQRVVESSRLWMWMGLIFALAGLAASWVSEVRFESSSDPSTDALFQLDAFSFAWRLGLVGVVLGLLAHPAVLPIALRWRHSVPTVALPTLIPHRLSQAAANAATKRPILAEGGQAIGRSAQALLWGVAAIFAVALLAVPAGKIMGSVFGSTPDDARSQMQAALSAGDGTKLAAVTGPDQVPVSTTQPAQGVQVRLEPETRTATTVDATVEWQGSGDPEGGQQYVRFVADYGGLLGIMPLWRAESGVPLPTIEVSGASSATPQVTANGTPIPVEGATLMPGAYTVEVTNTGDNVTWSVGQPRVDATTGLTQVDLQPTVTPAGEAAAKVAATNALNECNPDAPADWCPTSFASWNDSPTADDISIEADNTLPGWFVARGPTLSYNYDYGEGVGSDPWEMSVPLRIRSDGQWEAGDGDGA